MNFGNGGWPRNKWVRFIVVVIGAGLLLACMIPAWLLLAPWLGGGHAFLVEWALWTGLCIWAYDRVDAEGRPW